MATLTRNSELSSSSVWVTWSFPFLGLLQQSLPKWPFLPQFEQWIGLPSGPSFGDLFVFFAPSPFPEPPPVPPLLLHEEKPALPVRDNSLLALLDVAQVSDDLLHREPVQIKQGFD
jgi:hypothetical protein